MEHRGRRSYTAVLVTLFGVLAIHYSAEAQAPQSTKKEYTQHVSYVTPEASSLAERNSRGDAIVRARVLGGEVKGLREVGGERTQAEPAAAIPDLPDVVTESRVRVEEIIKDHDALVAPGGTLSVLQKVGSLETPEYRVRVEEEDYMALQPGAQYLLFLQWVPDYSRFMLAPDDIFQLDGGAVKSPARGRLGKSLVGKKSDELLQNVREAAASIAK